MVTKAKKTTINKKKTTVAAAKKTAVKKTTKRVSTAKPRVAQKKVVKKAPRTVKKVTLPKVKVKTNTIGQIIYMIIIIIFLAFMILKYHEII